MVHTLSSGSHIHFGCIEIAGNASRSQSGAASLHRQSSGFSASHRRQPRDGYEIAVRIDGAELARQHGEPAITPVCGECRAPKISFSRAWV